MKRNIDIDIYKFLFNRLDDNQKKLLLQKKNIQINTMQSNLVTKQSQWTVFLKLASSSLTNKNIQKAIVEYYLENIPNLKSAIENKEKHLEHLEILEEKDFGLKIEQYGFFYVLIYLLSKGYSEKVNKLIELKPEEDTIIQSDTSSNSEVHQNDLQEIKNLKNDLSNANKTIKGLKKKHETLEAKFSDYEKRKSKELTTLEKKHNSDIEEIFINWDNDKQKYETKLKLLTDENQLLKKQLNELYNSQQNREQEIKHETLEKNTFKKRQSKVLVFGNLPLNIQKDDKYNFVLFNHDISNYLFNENYDEYWLIEDKLSAKEKRQLKNNINSEKVNLFKKNYNDLIR